MAERVRIGIDLGGTKIEGLALDDSGVELARLRIVTPKHDYDATLKAILEVVNYLERRLKSHRGDIEPASVGIGIPGTIVRIPGPRFGLVKNANSTWLNDQPLERDLTALLGRQVRCANDANCLAVSEATDGAAAGARVVFAVILGTGCGGGIAVNGQVHVGPNSVAGEWGHNPLPWPTEDELPGPHCYCGRYGCIETWISGSGLARDHATRHPPDSGHPLSGAQVAAAAEAGDMAAESSLAQLEDRVGRSLASVVNLLDPDVIVIGGGLSKLDRIYTNVRSSIQSHLFGGGELATPILKAAHGDASGVRGAAWLWPAS
jgi:fructokinase